MSIVSHDNIEKSFNKFVYDNLQVPFSYVVSYREVQFDMDANDFWLSIAFDEVGAGIKNITIVRLDIFTRMVGNTFAINETIAIDRIRTVFTNAFIPLYDWTSGSPVLVPDEVLIVQNTNGRMTVDKVVLDNLEEDKLDSTLRKSSVFMRLSLLSDKTGGRVI